MEKTTTDILKKITVDMVLLALCVLTILFFFVPIWSITSTASNTIRELATVAKAMNMSLFQWATLQGEDDIKILLDVHYTTWLLALIPTTMIVLSFIKNKTANIVYIELSALLLLLLWVISDNMIFNKFVGLNVFGGIYVTICAANVIAAVIKILTRKDVKTEKKTDKTDATETVKADTSKTEVPLP